METLPVYEVVVGGIINLFIKRHKKPTLRMMKVGAQYR